MHNDKRCLQPPPTNRTSLSHTHTLAHTGIHEAERRIKIAFANECRRQRGRREAKQSKDERPQRDSWHARDVVGRAGGCRADCMLDFWLQSKAVAVQRAWRDSRMGRQRDGGTGGTDEAVVAVWLAGEPGKRQAEADEMLPMRFANDVGKNNAMQTPT